MASSCGASSCGITSREVITTPGFLTRGSIRCNVDRMRTTLDIPRPLIEEARNLLGFKSKTDTVVLALQELIRKRRVEELASLFGSIELELDLGESRRRPLRRTRQRP